MLQSGSTFFRSPRRPSPKMIRYFVRTCRNLIVEENATTAVEYAVMLALIILACIGAVLTTGGVQSDIWSDLSTDINGVVNN